MFKEKFESFKKLFKNENLTEKKKIQNLVFFLILLIITVIAINFIWSDGKDTSTKNTNGNKNLAIENNNTLTEVVNMDSSEYNFKESLEKILSNIKGAGAVQVLVTYAESSSVVAMYNENTKQSTTEEKDTGGGVRTIEQEDKSKEVIYTEENGKKIPVTEKVVMPKIQGAVILAEGANDIQVKNNIIQAVEAVTGLSVHKIQVFELKM